MMVNALFANQNGIAKA